MSSRGLVMVIDSDPKARELIGAYLVRLGYEARSAGDDVEARGALQGEDWPAVLVRDRAAGQATGSAFDGWAAGPRAVPSLLSMVKPFDLVDFGDKLLHAMRARAAVTSGAAAAGPAAGRSPAPASEA